ncbi:hypothetical protein [Duganella vulcania]|uniref:Uncharacterized protein n=1 Tax=Duganella vulcania TaxID=2692166 RepID=A0A845GFN8_9BURK|nr:hypothetical protein [Duganella vulcania]MYM92320.1 hypothetical protein [Duganella vulcania]
MDSTQLARRRRTLNRKLLGLTAINLLIFAAWAALRAHGAPNSNIVIGLLVLTLLTWTGLIIALGRRCSFWMQFQRHRT